MGDDAELKIEIFNVEQGQNEVILNEEQAKEMNIDIGDRVQLKLGEKEAVALVNWSSKDINRGEIGLFQEVVSKLNATKDERLLLKKAQRPSSLDYIRKKLDGMPLTGKEISEIITDLMEEKFSAAELAAFVSAVYTHSMNQDEIAALTNAMYLSGEYLDFGEKTVVSEHSIGGIPGDRVAMLIVPIIAHLGIYIPKTSSRAISSASGTADAMEVLTRVDLSKDEIERVVRQTNGCLVWGGGVNMAMADDRLIKIRNPLRLDPTPLLLSSILAKKKAEGAKYVLLDVPCGREAKIEKIEDAKSLAGQFKSLGEKLGMHISSIISDGSEPLIPTIGPALEAKAVLECLDSGGEKYSNLTEKACRMAGVMIEMVGEAEKEEGYRIAKEIMKTGKADGKFREVIEAQGGNPDIKPEDITVGKLTQTVTSKCDGRVARISNKAVFRICRALGAPSEKGAGIILRVKAGDTVKEGDSLFDMVTNSQGAMDYVLKRIDEYNVVEIERVIIDLI